MKKKNDLVPSVFLWNDIVPKEKMNNVTDMQCTTRRCELTNGSQYVGQLNDKNEREGVGTLFLIDESKHYEGEWKNDVYHGQGKLFFRYDGMQYKGHLFNGKKHGLGTTYRKNGTKVYKGEFRHDIRHGLGESYDDEGVLLYRGNWFAGKWNGLGQLFCDDGSVQYMGEFVDGSLSQALVRSATTRVMNVSSEDKDVPTEEGAKRRKL